MNKDVILIACLLALILLGFLAYLLVISFQEVKPNRLLIVKNLGGQIVDIIMGKNVDFHINHPYYDCYDPRFPEMELLPNKWGSPESINHMTLKWNVDDIDSRLSSKKLDEVEAARKVQFKYLKGKKEKLEKTLEETEAKIRQSLATVPPTDSTDLLETRDATNKMISELEQQLKEYADVEKNIKTYHLTNRLNFFGFYFIGLFPFKQKYEYRIDWSRLESLDYELKPNEQCIYKGKQFQVVMIKNDITDHIRIHSEIPVPFVNIETGKVAETTPNLEKKFEGIENISMEGIVMQSVRPTNVMRLLVNNQIGLIPLVTNGTLGIIKEVYGNSNYDSIVKSKDETGEEGSIVHMMSMLNVDTTSKGGNPGYPENFGFGIYKTTVLEVDASAGSKAFMEAAQKEAIAKKEAAATIAKADGDAYAIRTLKFAEGDGDAHYITVTRAAENVAIANEKVNPNVNRFAKALEKTGIQTFVTGNQGGVTPTLEIASNRTKLPDVSKYILKPEPKPEPVKDETKKDDEKDDSTKDSNDTKTSSNNSGSSDSKKQHPKRPPYNNKNNKGGGKGTNNNHKKKN